MTDSGPRASRPHAAGPPAVPYESTTARLVALIDHLGLARAHVATQIPADISGLAAVHPGRLGGIVLCAPVRLDPAPFREVGDRLLMISGEYGPTFEVCVRAADRLPEAQRHIIDNYEPGENPRLRRITAGQPISQKTLETRRLFYNYKLRRFTEVHSC